jgi:EAL domain-containing protein (putative c-di-GMP-specific phosphodiesterase class I)
MNAQASTVMRLENLLQQALKQQEFKLYYQPQVNINNGQIQGIEALLRWQHPELGMVSPTSFIKLAEQNGLIVPIGEWVLKTACTQNKLWQSQGLSTLRVSVNLSSVQLQQPNLPFTIADILEETELEADLLELEINAAILMHNVEYSRHILSQLTDLGVRICIDDFASGFSALNYLKKLPFHTLKIDQSFIQQLRNDPQDVAIVSALVSLGRGFNLRVVAEGVETEQQIELLRSLHCEQMQGFWFSHPLTAEDTTKMLPFDA